MVKKERCRQKGFDRNLFDFIILVFLKPLSCFFQVENYKSMAAFHMPEFSTKTFRSQKSAKINALVFKIPPSPLHSIQPGNKSYC